MGCGKYIKTLTTNVYRKNTVGQKESDYEMILIPLFCFCCHHCYLVMSVLGAWQFILFKKCVLPTALPNEDYCPRSTIEAAVRYLQPKGINEVWGDFYCGEQNNAKPASCLDFWLLNKSFLCVACECWLMICLRQTGCKGAH